MDIGTTIRRAEWMKQKHTLSAASTKGFKITGMFLDKLCNVGMNSKGSFRLLHLWQMRNELLHFSDRLCRMLFLQSERFESRAVNKMVYFH